MKSSIEVARTMGLLVIACLTMVNACFAMVNACFAEDDATRTVYHLHDGQAQSTMGMYNIQNHLKAEPSAQIIVVANFKGVEAFVFGAQDNFGKPFADWVDELSKLGVSFQVCQHSMNSLKIPADQLISNVQVVASGVAEIARLQSKQKFGYIRP